ncbi:MAG: hypothetical protein ACSHX8_13715 [Opitutaceae bacterium]
MNYKTLPLCLSLLLAATSTTVWAEDAAAEEFVMPTEISEAPYEVGQLPMEQGYYIGRGEEATKINFRIVDNKPRLYWIDENGLIAKPEASVASIRLTGQVRGRPYQQLTKLGGDAGLGGAGIIPAPHIFRVDLVIIDPKDPTKKVAHNFRYSAEMDIAKKPEIMASDGAKPKKPKY